MIFKMEPHWHYVRRLYLIVLPMELIVLIRTLALDILLKLLVM